MKMTRHRMLVVGLRDPEVVPLQVLVANRVSPEQRAIEAPARLEVGDADRDVVEHQWRATTAAALHRRRSRSDTSPRRRAGRGGGAPRSPRKPLRGGAAWRAAGGSLSAARRRGGNPNPAERTTP